MYLFYLVVNIVFTVGSFFGIDVLACCLQQPANKVAVALMSQNGCLKIGVDILGETFSRFKLLSLFRWILLKHGIWIVLVFFFNL